MQATSLESRIASLVHAQFDSLPRGSKPVIRDNGVREWIPMSGIVLVCNENTSQETLKCISVTTGAKCLPASQIPKNQGLLLHDSHAEILALRAFNYWLIKECRSILASEEQYRQHQHQTTNYDHVGTRSEVTDRREDYSLSSPFVRRRSNDQISSPQADRELLGKSTSMPVTWPPFELRNEVRVYMYCTCAPCGDASMELCMASQDDPTPWELPAGHTASNDREQPSASSEISSRLLDGRAHFSVLGVVRRKPSRADAESTLSKSCSDKLALRQITSLLSLPASLLVAPTKNAYLAGLILPEDEISRVGCQRAFGGGETGRLKPFSDRVWSDGNGLSYQYLPFTVKSLPTKEVEAQWEFGKPKHGSTEGSISTPTNSKTTGRSKPGNVSAVWIAAPSWSPSFSSAEVKEISSSTSTPKIHRASQVATVTGSLNESLLNGVKQGYRFSASTPRKASVLSRARMWELLRETILELNRSPIAEINDSPEGGEKCLPQDNGNLSNPIEASHIKTPLDHVLTSLTYEDLKRGFLDAKQEGMLRERVAEEAKDIMGGWIRNRGDEDWGMEVLKENEKVDRRRPR